MLTRITKQHCNRHSCSRAPPHVTIVTNHALYSHSCEIAWWGRVGAGHDVFPLTDLRRAQSWPLIAGVNIVVDDDIFARPPTRGSPDEDPALEENEPAGKRGMHSIGLAEKAASPGAIGEIDSRHRAICGKTICVRSELKIEAWHGRFYAMVKWYPLPFTGPLSWRSGTGAHYTSAGTTSVALARLMMRGMLCDANGSIANTNDLMMRFANNSVEQPSSRTPPHRH